MRWYVSMRNTSLCLILKNPWFPITQKCFWYPWLQGGNFIGAYIYILCFLLQRILNSIISLLRIIEYFRLKIVCWIFKRKNLMKCWYAFSIIHFSMLFSHGLSGLVIKDHHAYWSSIISCSLSCGISLFLSPCVLPLIPAYFTFITGFPWKNWPKTVIRK